MTQKSIDKLVDELNKKFMPDGSTLPVIASALDRPTKQTIPCTSPALGFVLGTGGWSLGHLHEFFGKEHAGKTTLMMLALKDVYEYHDGKKPIAYIDIEHRFNEDWAKNLGLPMDDLIVVQPTDAEQASDIMYSLIRPKDPSENVCAIGFDSIGAARIAKEHSTFDNQVNRMAGAAGVMTRNVQIVAPVANLYGTTVFYTNQLRADMAGYNRPMTPGGNAVKHQMSVRVYLWPSTKAESKRFDKIDGQETQVGFEMNFRVVKNTFGPPGKDGKSIFYFRPSREFNGVGFDTDGDIQTLGLLTEVIERRGSVYNYKDIKAQGREPFFKKLKEEGQYEALLADVNKHLENRLSMFQEGEDRGSAFIEIDDPEV